MNQKLERQFIQDFTDLQQAPDVTLHLTATAAWCLLGQIQLACRHPENDGPSRKVAEAVAREIEARLATTPTLWLVAEMGWDSRYDIARPQIKEGDHENSN